MKMTFLLATLLILAACSTAQPIPSRQAVEDFVSVSELESTDKIRHYDTLQHHNLNDHYIIMSTRKEDYLVEFTRRCHELNDRTMITPDVRHETNVIRARFDTIRGCRIKAIYPVNKGQVEELRSLGDAPGETLEIEERE